MFSNIKTRLTVCFCDRSAKTVPCHSFIDNGNTVLAIGTLELDIITGYNAAWERLVMVNIDAWWR